MTDFGIRHKGTAPQGSAVWYADTGNRRTRERPRNLARVDHDGQTYFYKVSRAEAGRFRRWAEAVFLANDGRDHLAGRFPSYSVETR